MGLLTKNQFKIIKNFNWLLGVYVYRFAIGFISLSFVTRYLGPERYGVYSYALSFFAFIEIVLLVLNQEVFKKEVLESNDEKMVVKTALLTRSIISVLVFLTAQFLLWGFDFETGMRRNLIFLFSLGLLARPLDVFSDYFSSQMRNDLIGKSELVAVTLFNGSRVFLAIAEQTLQSFAWVWSATKYVTAFFLGFYHYKNFSFDFLKSKVNFDIMKKMLKRSIPLFLAAAATVIFTRVDQIMLGNLLSDKAVGIYAVVVKLTEPWLFIASIFTQTIYPDLVKTYQREQAHFEKKLQKSFCILTYVSLGIIVGTYFAGEFLINLVFSSKYAEAIPIIKIHVFYVLFIYWIHLTNQFDVIVGTTKITLFKTSLASVFNIIANYYLIPKVGIVGATYATIISYSVSAFFVNLMFKKTRILFWLQIKSFLFWKISWFHKES